MSASYRENELRKKYPNLESLHGRDIDAVEHSRQAMKDWIKNIFTSLGLAINKPIDEANEKRIKRQFEFDKKWGNKGFIANMDYYEQMSKDLQALKNLEA